MPLNQLKSRKMSIYHHKEKLTPVINKKTVRYHLDKAISEFSILPHKRGLLNVAKHVMKTSFWTAVYLAFSYLTISWTFELIQQFRDNPVTTNMKAIINNKVINYPNITICLKINPLELLNISSASSFNYTSAWSRFFEETTFEGIFKVSASQVYDDEIYLSLFKYLAMIYEAERAWEPGLAQISTFHSDESDDWIALKKVLVPNIEHYNITFEQLKSIFDRKLCSLPVGYPYNHLLDLVNKPSKKTECVTGSKISFFGMDTICFRLIGYQSHLRQLGSTDYVDLFLYDDGKNQKWREEFTIDLGSESRSAPRRATTRNETYGFYYNHFSDDAEIYLDIGIKALYRKLPYVNGNVQCSSDTSREECENKCLREWIRTNCHCTPTTFNLTNMSSYRNCTVDDYSICLKKYAENATSMCTNQCVPLCEQWHYEYNLRSIENSYSYIQMSPVTFDYVIIEQVFTWNTFEQFIGALGGALGIWLGVDFVIIAELILRLVTRLVKKILLRDVQDPEEDKQEESAKIKQREKNVENGISPSNVLGRRVIKHQKRYKEDESEIAGTSIREINESKKQVTSRKKKRESNTLEEKHMQQRRKRSNNSGLNRAKLDDKKMKNVVAYNRSQRIQELNMIENIDADQDEPTAHAHNSTSRSWFLQKVLVLFLNGDASRNKSTMFLQVVEKLCWVTIYFVGSVFTTLWCVELINLYLADEAVYYPSLIINRTVTLPPPSLCVLHRRELNFERHGNISSTLMDYFNQSNRTSFIQTSDGNAWPVPLVSIGLLYFGILAASEINYDDVSFNSKYESQLNLSAGNDTLLRNDIDESLNDILLPKLLEWKVTANELRQKLGAELARLAELKISFTNINGTTDIVKEASFYTSAVTDELFCYGLTYKISFTNPNDVLEFSISNASYAQYLSGWSNYMIFSDYLLEPESAQSNFNPYNVAVSDSTYFFFDFKYVTRALISVDGLYTSRPAAKDVKFCSPNTTKSYCRALCSIELIEKLCNCSPTYWDMMIRSTSGLDECTFDRYMECVNFAAYDDFDCKNSCLPFCTAKYFQSDLTWNGLSEKYSDIAVIRFSVKDGVYVSIEEKPIFIFSDLLIKNYIWEKLTQLSLAQLSVSFVIKLGGTLGILLGFNIYSFYQVLVATAKLCFAFILKITRITQSRLWLSSLDKIEKSGITQVISYLNKQLFLRKNSAISANIQCNHIGRIILLTIGYMSGIYATVRMSNDLYNSFKIGESTSHIDLMMNDTIRLTPSTICMPLYSVEFLSKKEIRQLEQNTNLTKNHLNSFNSKEEFLSEHWSTWLVQRAYEYLTICDIVERHGNQKFISAFLLEKHSHASKKSRNTISNYNVTLSLMELDELIDRLNITIPELKQNLGQKVRDIYKTKAVFMKEVDGAWNRTILNITETTFIGEEKVCYKLPLDTVTFSSKSDYISILLDRGSLPNPQISNNKKPITIDFSGRDVSKEQLENYFIFGSAQSFWFGEPNLVKLDISKIYRAMPVSSGVRHCSESKSMDTCLDECQQKKIERICNCSPTKRSSFPSNTNLTRCHLIDYKRCAKFLISTDEDRCELSCVPHCTRISFKDKRSLDEQAIASDNVALISLTVNSFEYLSIKEAYKYTMTDFISEFGGILGLWIGLDFLAFVNLFYWLICEGYHTFRQFL